MFERLHTVKVWSRGLGKQALNLDFAKSDVVREGNEVIIKGILRSGGIIWDTKVTFTKEDIPGLLYFVLSFPVLFHLLRNIGGFFIFIRERFILRRMGLPRKGGS